jgi:glycosyltransferase involved in cell wall biosynthesis
MARILYLHQHFSTPDGSTATRSFAMARALARRGHAVTLATGRFGGAVSGLSGPFRAGRRDGRVGGFAVVEFDIGCNNAQGLAARGAAFGRFAARATPLALGLWCGPWGGPWGGRWDLVVASSTPLTVALPAILARRLRGTPFLFEMRDPWPELPAALGLDRPLVLGAMGRLADAACRGAAAVVALSEGMAETARARGARRVEVIGQGCDLDLFSPWLPPLRPDCAASHEVVAVYAGAHGRANGLPVLLEAAARLRAAGEQRVRLVLIGEGSEKAALVAEAAARGLSNVSFLDPMPKHELGRVLAASQVGLLCLAPVPEFAEWTAPNKLMDLLAAGLPVVSNAPGAAARLLAAEGLRPLRGARGCGGAGHGAGGVRRPAGAAAGDGGGGAAAGRAAVRPPAARRALRCRGGGGAGAGGRAGPPRPSLGVSGGGVSGALVLLLSAAHPADDMRVVRKEGAALAAAGWRVRHLCPGDAETPARCGAVELEAVPGLRRRGRWLGLLRRAVALRPAVIHASEPDAWAVALLAGRRCGARVVLTCTSTTPPGSMRGCRRGCGRWRARRCAGCWGRWGGGPTRWCWRRMGWRRTTPGHGWWPCATTRWCRRASRRGGTARGR